MFNSLIGFWVKIESLILILILIQLNQMLIQLNLIAIKESFFK